MWRRYAEKGGIMARSKMATLRSIRANGDDAPKDEFGKTTNPWEWLGTATLVVAGLVWWFLMFEIQNWLVIFSEATEMHTVLSTHTLPIFSLTSLTSFLAPFVPVRTWATNESNSPWHLPSARTSGRVSYFHDLERRWTSRCFSLNLWKNYSNYNDHIWGFP